ncbi:MarR family winged helix-turn-helix transcriptional regulator [Demequina sediminicola]|uniref:MarR family winged helix-turn-helix transcriptional regulator n=1 Tax=Demequina sediminicola TaxID=1095026 RepID=UPI000781CDEE|nr:MarR family winged helix-turn-helix transcriptional regulator [Demequina sediminicola]
MSDKLSYSLHEATTALDSAMESFLAKEYSVTLSQFVFLANCSEIEPCDITRLAHKMVVSKAAVSKRVASLVDLGWLETGTDPAHARRVMLSLTDEARRLVSVATADLEQRLATVFEDPRAAHIDTRQLNKDLTIVTALLEERGSL